MKTKAICFASRLLTMAFAVCVSLSFAACGDDDEPSVDELLSDKTTPNILDTNGNRIATTAMPSFSLRRGYITVLTGPLFSGSTSDWTVEYEPFDDEGY